MLSNWPHLGGHAPKQDLSAPKFDALRQFDILSTLLQHHISNALCTCLLGNDNESSPPAHALPCPGWPGMASISPIVFLAVTPTKAVLKMTLTMKPTLSTRLTRNLRLVFKLGLLHCLVGISPPHIRRR